MQLRHYTWVLWHWLWLILLGTGICSISTYSINKYLIQPVYQATALVQVNASLTSSGANDVFGNQALAVADAVLITSTDTLQEAAKKIPSVSFSQLKQLVSASPQAGTQIIQVQAHANNPQLAADIANTVVSVFIQSQADKGIASLEDLNLQPSQLQSRESQAKNALILAQTAIPPDQPSSPDTSRNTLIAAAMGLLLMVVLTLLLDWLDATIQTPEDVTNLALLEPLGSVPFSKQPLLLATLVNPSELSDDAIQRAFILISSRFNLLSKSPCAILMTSLQPGSGVTTTAINLAIAFTQSGKRVLLVDTNQRRSSLHELFRCPNTKGLANSLADVYQFQNGFIQSWLNLWRTNIGNLWVLPAGPVATHSRITGHLQELQMLTNWLLRKNQNISGMSLSDDVLDIIIFDAPALDEGSDTVALATVTDCSALVVQAGKERKEVISKARATLQQLGSPILGVVVNRQTTKHRPYFYTDASHRQNTILVGSSLEEALVARQTVSPHTPPSLLQVNQKNSLSGQLAFPDEDRYEMRKGNLSSTPLPLERSSPNQFRYPSGSTYDSNPRSQG